MRPRSCSRERIDAVADDDEAGCVCRAGMRPVTDVWARQEAGIPRDADLTAPAVDATQDELEAMAAAGSLPAQAVIERAAVAAALVAKEPRPETPAVDRLAAYTQALNTVFPCPTCRPGQFARWRHGCYKLGHQPKRCKLCKDAKK